MATLMKIHPLRETHNFLERPTLEFTDVPGAMNGPFRATQRWNSIIQHLQDNVDMKPPKTKAKRHEECFTGTAAVDVLLPYLQQSGFERDISRENAVKLCQLLLEQSIFEDVLMLSQLPPNTKPTFQDNSAHLYRFVKDANQNRRSSKRFSDSTKVQTQKRLEDDEGSSYPQFDRKKKFRYSFGAGKTKNDNREDENDGGTDLASLFDRKKKKRASFGFGKLCRVDNPNPVDSPPCKKKQKRSSFGLGKLKNETSYNIGGSFESVSSSQGGDKRRASFRLHKHKLESNRNSDVGSQDSLYQPECKKSRLSFGNFRLGKRTADTKNKDVDTTSITSEASQQSEAKLLACDTTGRPRSCTQRSDRSQALRDIGDDDVTEIWKECTVQRLLELMDIPILEDILSCTEDFAVPCSSSGSVANKGNSKQDITRDPLFSSGIACLQSQPEGAAVAASFLRKGNSQSQASVHARKLLLFQTLANRFAERKRPLVPAEFQEILTAVLGFIARGKTSKAIEIMQLAVMMLGNTQREELQRLLHFMATASSKQAVKLSYEIDNRVTVITSFTPAIIPSQILSSIHAKNVVSFMMDCADRIYTVPQRVAERAEKRIARWRAGLKDINEYSYCIRITPQEYQRQCMVGTEAALCALTNTVIDDVKIPLREKKQHLQSLKKHHPKLHEMHFANML